MTKAENLLEQLFSEFVDFFNNLGFIPNKKKNIYSKNNGEFRFNYLIHTSGGRNKENIVLHLTLDLIHIGVSNLYKKTANEIKKDNIDLYIPKGKVVLCSLTDWKNLYVENNLPNAEIWYTVISKLGDIKLWRDQLEDSIIIANKWFENHINLENIILFNLEQGFTNSITTTMCAIKYFNPSYLDEFYNDLALNKAIKNVDIFEVSKFYQILSKDKE